MAPTTEDTIDRAPAAHTLVILACVVVLPGAGVSAAAGNALLTRYKSGRNRSSPGSNQEKDKNSQCHLRK